MIDPELSAKLDAIEAKAEAAHQSAEKVRKYLFWMGVASVVVFVVPLIGLLFVVPQFLSSYTTTLGGLGY